MTELWLRRQRLAAVVSVYTLAILFGAWFGFTAGGPCTKSDAGAYSLIAILTSLGFMWLCTVDAGLLGKPLMWSARLGIFFGWPVGMPIYLLWSRGAKGIGLLLSHGILFLLVTAMSMFVGGIATLDPFSS